MLPHIVLATLFLSSKIDMPNMVTYRNQRLNSSAMWSKNIYRKCLCLKKIRLHVPNMLIILRSIVNILGGGGGKPILPFDELNNLYFGNELDIHIIHFEILKESGYGLHSKDVSNLILIVHFISREKWATLIIPISVCRTNFQNMHYFSKFQNQRGLQYLLSATKS
jgi:hypothetical protein